MAARKEFSPELWAHSLMRYRRGDPVTEIAVDCKVHERTMHKIIKRAGWSRESPPCDLSPAVRLLEEVRALALEAGVVEADAAPEPTPVAWMREAISGAGGQIDPPVPHVAPLMRATASQPTGAAKDPAVIDRMERAVLNELGVVERTRAQLGPGPQRTVEAQQTARTLASLTQTLELLGRMRQAATSPAGLTHVDMPRDLDEFRRRFARRIHAFVESRTGGDVRGAGGPGGADPGGL